MHLSERDTILLCFSHLRWGFVFQRPQHLMTRACQDAKVYFIEEPLVRPNATADVETSHPAPGIEVVTPLYRPGSEHDLVALQRGIVAAIIARHPLSRIVSWYYTPMALEFSVGLASDVTVYDCMDELSAFRGAPPGMLERERQLFRRADLLFTGGHSLYQAKRGFHSNAHPFPSSIDKEHFLPARRPRRGSGPADQCDLPKPRIGFFGVIDERMDLELVDQLADLRPDWHYVMLGPVVKIEPAALPRRPNLHWLGQKTYAELPDYLAGWQAGFMPFALNEATRFISPTKTPEFLAAGVPVTSTPIADVVNPYGLAGLVGIASNASDFAKAIEATMESAGKPWLKAVDAHLANLSWDRTWADMCGLIDAVARREATTSGRMERQRKEHAHV